jgi:undecaprenyl diphosphate synthase
VSERVAAACREAGLDPGKMPKHVAIIMDGNGRWAKKRGWLRTRGHQQGVTAVRTATTESVRLGIDRLTLYAFSSENWQRPKREIDTLMGLLERFLIDELPTLLDNGVRLRAIGHLDRLPPAVSDRLAATIEKTKAGPNTILTLALSYGGRDELVDAARALARLVQAGELDPADIDEERLSAELYDGGIGDVDLLIRTAGERRLSNFLPWQAVYAEYLWTDALWPDFDEAEYHAALSCFQTRQRRFGGV